MNSGDKLAFRALRLCARALATLWASIGLTAVACCQTRYPCAEEVLVPHAASAGKLGRFISLESRSAASSIPLLGAASPHSFTSENQLTLNEALGQAETALKQGHLEEALSRCQAAVGIDPNSARAYFLLGLVQIQRGDSAAAQHALLQSVKADPSRAAAHFYLGKIYLQANELPAAENEFQSIVKLGDASGSGQYGLALILLAKSRFSDALPYLLAAVKANPRDPERLFTLAGTELQLKQVDPARRSLARIRRLFPDDPRLSYRLGNLLVEYHMLGEAETEFEHTAEVLQKSKDVQPPPTLKISDVFLQLARLRFDHHDYWGALRYFENIDPADVSPNLHATAAHLEGEALLGAGKMRQALEKLREAARMNASNPEYLAHWTWAELLAGDMKEAASVAELAKTRWPDVPDVQLMLSLVAREAVPARKRIPYSQGWHMKGEGLVCCPCKVPCPCRSNAPPTYGHCENAGLIQVAQGHYGTISLDGFVFVTMNASMSPQSPPMFVYVGRSATDEQLIALERLMQAFDPLHPSILLHIKRAEISYRKSPDGKTYDVEVPGVLRMSVRRQLDSKGQPLSKTAALDDFSNVLEYAQNLTFKVWEPEGKLKWDFSGRQANFRVIDLDYQEYENGRMLKQFADGSGSFNEKQWELIKKLKLPTPSNYPKVTKSETRDVALSDR